MDHPRNDDPPISVRRLSPAGPAVIWGALMVVALAAAGATAFTAADVASERLVATSDAENIQRSVRQLAAQRDDLANRLARLEQGVGEMKLAAAQSAATAQTVATAQPAAAAQPLPAAQPMTAAQAVMTPQAVTAPQTTIPLQTVVAARTAPAAQDITGSIGRTAPHEPKPAAFAISLGQDASADEARRRWAALSARYPQMLSRLTVRTAKRNGAYDLLAGPFAARGDADRICVALAIQGHACDTTAFVGETPPRP